MVMIEASVLDSDCTARPLPTIPYSYLMGDRVFTAYGVDPAGTGRTRVSRMQRPAQYDSILAGAQAAR